MTDTAPIVGNNPIKPQKSVGELRSLLILMGCPPKIMAWALMHEMRKQLGHERSGGPNAVEFADMFVAVIRKEAFEEAAHKARHNEGGHLTAHELADQIEALQ